MTNHLTPTERMILKDLRLRSPQTASDLFLSSGVKSQQNFGIALRTLRIGGYIVTVEHNGSDTTFALPVKA